MTAPLQIFSGAPVAQNERAAAGIALKINLAAQERATALFAVAQRRSKLDFISKGNPGAMACAATQQDGKERMMKAIVTDYANQRFRSRLEARWAAFFDLAGWDWTYEPFDLEGWAPDFALHMPGAEVLVEIKPTQLVRHEVGAWVLPSVCSEFDKAKRHVDYYWILALGCRPQTHSDFFSIGTLYDPPIESSPALTWVDVNRMLGVPDEMYLWREAGNLVQWLGKKQQGVRCGFNPESVS